jgi:hypothetical protein
MAVNTNYRKFYQQKTGVELPAGFEVHHIDGNKENNNIENLVALPVEIHRQWHEAYNEVQNVGSIDLTTIVPNMINQPAVFFYMDVFDKYFRACAFINVCLVIKQDLITGKRICYPKESIKI